MSSEIVCPSGLSGEIRGLKMVYEPEYLRFFQARFESIPD